MTRAATARALLACAALAGCASNDRKAPAQAAASGPLALPPLSAAPREDYRIGPRDVLSIQVFELEKRGELLKLELEVTGTGQLAVPYAGALSVAGRTAEEVRRELVERLSPRYLQDAQVVVGVKDYRAVDVAVTGAVVKPGVVYAMRNRVTLLDALALAGGLDKGAGTRAVVMLPPSRDRGQRKDASATLPDRIEVDLVELLAGTSSRALELEPGAQVFVPEAQPFFVGGYVNHPGSFPYQRPTTVLQAVALAGGLHERKASASAVRLKRPLAGGGVSVTDVDLDAIVDGSAPDPPVLPGDSVEVGRTLVWAIYTETVDTLRGFVGFGISAGGF